MGTSSITASTRSDNYSWQMRVGNSNPTAPLILTVDGVIFDGPGKALTHSQDGFLFSGVHNGAAGALDDSITLKNSFFYNNHAYMAQIDTIGARASLNLDNNEGGKIS